MSITTDSELQADASPVINSIVLANGSELKLLNLVRQVPNKRLVYQAVWLDMAVYAKVFIGENPQKYAQRDLQGIQRLLDANILTPKILLNDVTADGASYVLILEEISHAMNVEVVWHGLPLCSNQRLQIALDLVIEIAKHHNAGLQQTDLYLKNFLLQENRIFTLDGDGIKPLPKFNDGQTCLRNLSALLSKLDVLEIENWLPALLKTYGNTRGWQTLPRLELMQHLIQVHRTRVTNDYADRKVFRTCTDVQVNANSNQYFAVARSYVGHEVLSDVNALDHFLLKPAFKSGNTCTVGLLNSIGAQKVVIKRYNVKSTWHGVMRSFRKTRAAASWSNAHRLNLLGLPTIQPVSLLEERFFFGKLRAKSYFLSTYINAPDVDVFFATERDIKKRVDAVKQIVELFYRLYLLNISHGDMKASNIKIVDNQPVLIDLDSMKQRRFVWFAIRSHARDLRRFMRNWQADADLTAEFKSMFNQVYTDRQPLKLAHII